MSTSMVIVVCAAVVVAIVVFAAVESLTARRWRARLGSIVDDGAIRRAALDVVEARRALSVAVDAHESALQRSPQQRSSVAGWSAGADGSPSDATEQDPTDTVARLTAPDRLPALTARRDDARAALFAAQRRWEAMRPPYDAAHRVGVWSGRGWVRSWQLGPIGFERIVVRIDHVLDPGCWLLAEWRRPRFGLGLGCESLGLAVFAAAVPARRLGALLDETFSGHEAAFRPGTSALRWWWRSRRSAAAANATAAVLRDRRLAEPPNRTTVRAVHAAVAEEFGPFLVSDGLPGIDRPTAIIHTSGPSLLFGAWIGGRPARRRIAASSHTVWREFA